MTKRCQFLKYVFDEEGRSIAKCNAIDTPENCPKYRAKCCVTQTCWQVKA